MNNNNRTHKIHWRSTGLIYIYFVFRYGPVGFGMATNKFEYEENFIRAIRTAFSDRFIEIDILTCEGTYCGAHGYLYGKHTGDFLGESASQKDVRLR